MSTTVLSFLDHIKKLREGLENVPNEPGVYIHRDHQNQILYVGKAKNLRARLKSYFTGLEKHTPKTRALVQKIQDYEIILTANEYESLVLEHNLIKHNKPPYNILLRDDKTYPYLKINVQDPWPQITLTRKRKNDGALYFGPYTSGGQVSHVLNIIQRFFPLVKCTPSVFKSVKRPCNYYDVKKCLGPCHLPVDPLAYKTLVTRVVQLLQGKHKELVAQIKADMLRFSTALDFENAALMRDQLKALQGLSQSTQSVTLHAPIDADVISSAASDSLAVFYVSHIRQGKLVGGDYFTAKIPLYEEAGAKEELFSLFLCQFYETKEVPPCVFFPQAHILDQDTRAQIEQFLQNTAQKTKEAFMDMQQSASARKAEANAHHIIVTQSTAFYRLYDKKVPQKTIDVILSLCQKNADNKLQEALRMSTSAHEMLDDVKQLLLLEEVPRHMECFDISTFQGAQTVASQVVFEDGMAQKNAYRKYIIKDVTGKSDDFASLREVIRRRFKETQHLPHLVLIDGGTPQVREVAWTLKSLGLEKIFFVGIAKSRTQGSFQESQVMSSLERLVVPKRNAAGDLLPDEPPYIVPLEEGSPAYRILTQMRDEAHRFAITFHRKKRDKKTLSSLWDRIEGLGPKRKKQLLKNFPNIQDIIQISTEEIAQKTAVPVKVIEQIKAELVAVSNEK